MKIQEKGQGPVQGPGRAGERAAEVEGYLEQFESAVSGLSRLVQEIAAPAPAKAASAPKSAPVHQDAYAAEPAAKLCRVEGRVSSVTPRQRGRGGAPVHAILAANERLASLGGQKGDGFAHVFDFEGRTQEDRLRAEVPPEKLLSFYENSMAGLHKDLGRLDFARSQSLWHERYREDLYRSFEEADRRDRIDRSIATDLSADRRWETEDATRRYADEMAYASREADRLAYELDAARRRDMDDWRNRR